MTKARLAPTLLVVSSLALAVAGCGGGEGSGSADPASLAPPRSLLFVEASLQPEGKLRSNVEAVARKVAGVDDLGGLIVSELESSREDGDEPLEFEKVEPWLGERAAVFFESFAAGDFTDFGVIVETTDVAATRAFIDEQASGDSGSYKDGVYEGVEYTTDTRDYTPALGVVGDFLVVAEDVGAFERAVDAGKGDSLADEGTYEEAISAAVEGSFADVYADLGRLIEQSKGEIDEEGRQVLQVLQGAGVDLGKATAVASILPGSDRVEIDINGDFGDGEAPSGDASRLLGSLPGNAFAAFAFTDFGEQLEEAIDELDRTGIPGEIPPRKLKSGVREVGFDLEKIAGSFEDAGIFASGDGESDIGGAFVLRAGGSREVATAISTIGTLVRQSGTPGVTALSGNASGFSIRDREELGPRPLVVAAKGDRVAIGYGVRQTLRGLTSFGDSTLSSVPAYDAAVAALGTTPISGFVDGPGALQLADAFISSSNADFEEAKPYLRKIRFIAIGSSDEGDPPAARLIVGLEE